jgi:hypothetical protein
MIPWTAVVSLCLLSFALGVAVGIIVVLVLPPEPSVEPFPDVEAALPPPQPDPSSSSTWFRNTFRRSPGGPDSTPTQQPGLGPIRAPKPREPSGSYPAAGPALNPTPSPGPITPPLIPIDRPARWPRKPSR